MKETPTSAVTRDDDSLRSPAIKLFRQVTPRKLGMKCPPSLRNRIQSTCLDDAAHLKTYMRLWVLIEYDKLPGSVGDERWRQEAVESNLTIAHK